MIYLGQGLFSNFWRRKQTYTLERKALELFHWRHGTYRDAEGELQMDEAVVDDRVAQTAADPLARAQVLERMSRLRDPSGVYAEGGCIDATREFPRPLETLSLPELCVF